jgi:putative addiction module component (TIGR02574 family)
MKAIQKLIKELSPAEKILLVEDIWDSIADSHYAELTKAEKSKFDKRLALIKSGKATFHSVSEIKAKFKALK